MRKNHKKKAAAAGTIVALVGAGAAFAYWTTTGSGTGTASTTAGAAAAASVTSDALTAMYPGDSAQNVRINVKNTSTTQKAYVSGLAAWVTTNQTGCDGDDFLLNGDVAPSAQADAAPINWTAVEIAADTTVSETDNTIQFNNKPTTDQGACKGAAVTIHYLAS